MKKQFRLLGSLTLVALISACGGEDKSAVTPVVEEVAAPSVDFYAGER